MKYIIEIEGFKLTKKFIVKEITIRNLQREMQHFLVKSPFSFDKLSYLEKRTVKYCESNLHLIHWRAGNTSFGVLKNYLQSNLTNESEVYIKGAEKVNVLRNELGLTCTITDVNQIEPCTWLSWKVDLSDVRKRTSFVPCPLYFHRDIVHCTNLKVQLISEKLRQDEMHCTQ